MGAEEFLEPEKAFKLAARTAEDGAVHLQFEVADGYYLYREPFRFVADGRVLSATLPPGQRKFDETFQKEVETYRHRLAVALSGVAGAEVLEVSAQGCADAGLCYAPTTVQLTPSSGGTWVQSAVVPGGPVFGEAAWREEVTGHSVQVPWTWLGGVLGALSLVGVAAWCVRRAFGKVRHGR